MPVGREGNRETGFKLEDSPDVSGNLRPGDAHVEDFDGGRLQRLVDLAA